MQKEKRDKTAHKNENSLCPSPEHMMHVLDTANREERKDRKIGFYVLTGSVIHIKTRNI